MSVLLTSATYINGVLTAAGTTVSLGYIPEYNLVYEGSGTWVIIPKVPVPPNNPPSIDYSSVGSTFSQVVDKPLIKSGTFLGTSAPQFSDIGFEPDLVIVVGAGNYSTFYAKPNWYGTLQSFGHTALSGSDGVPGPAVQQTGLGIITNQNVTGTTYYYIAIKDNGSGILKTFAYNGFRNKTVGAPDNQGTVSNTVVMDLLAGTQPSIVHIKRDATGAGHEGVWATTSFVKKESAAAINNTLLTLAIDGTMTLSTDISVNENDGVVAGEAHNCFSLHSPGVFWDLKTYVGNGGIQDIPCTGEIAAAIIIPQAAVSMEFWVNGMGTSSSTGSNTTFNTGRLTANGKTISLGSSTVTNAIGVTYSLVVFYKSESFEKAKPRIKQGGLKITTVGSSHVACGTDVSLTLAGAHSMEWIGQVTDATTEQFLMGRGGNATTGARGTPTAGSWNYAMSYTKDPDAGLEICTSDQFSNQSTSASKQQRFRTGIVLRPFEDYHLGYSHDGIDLWILYVNGVPVKWRRLPMSVFAINGITATTGLTMSFGGRISSGTYAAADKTIHRFGRIYNRVLTATEWSQMYARNYMSVTLNDLTDSATSLVEEWKFNDTTGTTVLATKNAANNGTITNGVWI
jgi:hypothetical protein